MTGQVTFLQRTLRTNLDTTKKMIKMHIGSIFLNKRVKVKNQGRKGGEKIG